MQTTVEQFTKIFLHAGIMTADELQAFQAALPADRRPRDSAGLARELVRAHHLTHFQANLLYQGKPLVLGDYLVLDKIGEGGMGVVLKAQHRRMKRFVAIKILTSGALKDETTVKRFHREIEATAGLSHPNIVAAYDAREEGKTHYMVMEYVEGQNLSHLVKEQGPLPVERAVDYILQAARGLECAHKQGIVHRDIKPGNLLLDRSGTVKILDMGLARLNAADGDNDRLTATGQVVGTCEYIAPEQAMDSHRVDPRADVYSLGCTLFRLLTGEPPYKGDTFVNTLLAHMEQPIPSLRQRRNDVPERLDMTFHKMVAKKPEDRYQSVTELIAELEIALTAPPPAAATARKSPTETSPVASAATVTVPAPPPKSQTAAASAPSRRAPAGKGRRGFAWPAWLPAGRLGTWVLVAIAVLGVAFIALAALLVAMLFGSG